MARFTRTARAEQDLIEIWTYIARDNLTAADRLLDRIDDVCATLAEFPNMGEARPDLAEQLRYFVAGAYLVLYREVSGGVEIVRVVHGARNLPGLLR
ncbi:MAG: type II toxin-antitoxin system RelE/ParE family toxin [Caulobacteraceae bacterium]